MGMTSEDDFSISQRNMRLMNRNKLDISDLPPPTKFRSVSKARNQPIRAFSTGDMDSALHEDVTSFGAGTDRGTIQVHET